MISLDSYLDGITTVAISGHIRPDGDCVGSCLAVYNYICDNYPTIMADLYLEPIPEKFLFLKNADKIRHMKSTDGKKEYDLFIALDCGQMCIRDRMWTALVCPGSILKWQKVRFVWIIISVTSHLLILITFFQMQVLPQNWYIS